MRAYLFLLVIIIALINFTVAQYQINKQDDILDPKGSLRLPTDLEPIKYKLELEPFFEPLFMFNGKVEIEFGCIKPTSRIIIHVKNLTIEDSNVKLKKNDEMTPSIRNIFEIENKNFLVLELTSALKTGNIYKLAINYKGNLSDDNNGFYRSSYEATKGTKRWLAATQFEATDARKALPCFDEPAMKAVFEVTIVRPKDMVALSNTEILESMPRDNSMIADRFKPTLKMSTYLLAFVVCDFDYRETKTKRGIQVRVWAQRDLIHEAQYSLQLAAKTIDFYEHFFGIDFPLNKMDLIALPDFNAGAMENWGLITFRESRLLYNEEIMTARLKQSITVTVTHELGHQWFGNLVTMEWWDDLWLNEGFATSMEYVSANYSQPSWHLDDQFVYEDMRGAQIADSYVESHPISAPVSNPDEIDEIFDDISYSKGASLIRMMNFILGSDTFRKGLHNYLQTYSYKNAVQEDLWLSLMEAARSEGNDIHVAEIMATWTLQMGYPVITISRDYELGKTYIQQNYFSQHMGAKRPRDKSYVWEVPVTITSESDMNWDTPQIIWLHSNNETMDNLLAETNQWIIGNSKLLGYYRVNYDIENWKMLTEQLMKNHKEIHSNNRGQIIFDSFALARAGLLDYQIPLDVSQYLIKETNIIAWELSLSGLSKILSMLQSICKDKIFRKYMVSLLLPSYEMVGWEEDIKEDPHIKKLFRSLVLSQICKIGYKHCISNAKDQFNKWKVNPKKIRLSPNLKPIILCNGVRFGDKDDWEFMWREYLTLQEVSEKNIILEALACSRDKEILRKYLQMTLDSEDIRRQDGTRIMSLVAANPKGYLLTWNFFKTKWAAIRKKFSSSSWSLKNALSYLSNYFSTEEQLNELKEFYTSNKNNVGATNRSFKQAIEETQGNVLWMEKNLQFILNWLHNKM